MRLMALQPYSGYVVTLFLMTWILAVTMICDCVAMSRHLNVKSCDLQLLPYSSLLLVPCVRPAKLGFVHLMYAYCHLIICTAYHVLPVC
jgi:hypothetical protein